MNFCLENISLIKVLILLSTEWFVLFYDEQIAALLHRMDAFFGDVDFFNHRADSYIYTLFHITLKGLN